ncbi:MAG: hypothetical protein IAE78_10645 [Myxococcus sp.]|nr:hypothetical protein [Myxococcus sp.]
MTKRVRSSMVMAVLVMAACGGGQECARDSDCKGSRVCNRGACTEPGGTGLGAGGSGGSGGGGSSQSQECSSGKDSDCPVGFWCNQDLCVATTKKKVGELCRSVDDCAGASCLVRVQGDVSGYCSKQCNSFSECPTFWDCTEITNGAGKRCQQR